MSFVGGPPSAVRRTDSDARAGFITLSVAGRFDAFAAFGGSEPPSRRISPADWTRATPNDSTVIAARFRILNPFPAC